MRVDLPDDGVEYGGSDVPAIRWRIWLIAAPVAGLAAAALNRYETTTAGVIFGIAFGLTTAAVVLVTPLVHRGFHLPEAPILRLTNSGMSIRRAGGRPSSRRYWQVPWSMIANMRLVAEAPPTVRPCLHIQLTEAGRHLIAQASGPVRRMVDTTGTLIVPDLTSDDLPRHVAHFSNGACQISAGNPRGQGTDPTRVYRGWMDFGGNGLPPMCWRRKILGGIAGGGTYGFLIGFLFGNTAAVAGLVAGILAGLAWAWWMAIDLRGGEAPEAPAIRVTAEGAFISLAGQAKLASPPYLRLPWSTITEVEGTPADEPGGSGLLRIRLTEEGRQLAAAANAEERGMLDSEGQVLVPRMATNELFAAIEDYSDRRCIRSLPRLHTEFQPA